MHRGPLTVPLTNNGFFFLSIYYLFIYIFFFFRSLIIIFRPKRDGHVRGPQSDADLETGADQQETDEKQLESTVEVRRQRRRQ